MTQIKDLFTIKENKANKQISLDVKKRIFKKLNLEIDDILNLKVSKKIKEFDSW